MSNIDAKGVFDNVGEILYEIEPEITEMIEEVGISPKIAEKILELEKIANELKEIAYEDFYKDE